MLLCEEYLKRHHIQIPLVKHTTEAAVFFRDHEEDNWCVKYIRWHSGDAHPGSYTVDTMRSVHDGLEKGHYFECCDEVEVQWDEYEQYLLDWASFAHQSPCTDQEVMVVSWEILLRCCDRGLIRHIHYHELSASIDTDLPIDQRCSHIGSCLKYFAGANYDVHRLWDGELANYRKHYAYWLAEMVCKK